MKFLDLLGMSVGNLRRRKLRTALTVLGVIIGTASIVVMVSLGIGLKELQVEQYSASGSMTAITIYSGGGGGYRMVRASSTTDKAAEPKQITDEVIRQFEGMEHVKFVSPILSTSVIMRQGLYQASTQIQGVTRKYMEDMKLGQGKMPKKSETELKLIYGNGVIQWFSNYKTGAGYWETGKLPEVDYMGQPMFVIFDTDAYYQSQGNADPPVKAPKKYLVDAAGVIEGGVDDYNSNSYSIYADIEVLKSELKKVYKKKPIPGQPTNKKGKPYNYFVYEQAVVYADDMANVTTLQKQINDMGFQANSQMEWLEQSQQTSNMIQAVLGGIGAVSLFVAAIGIANTMMMSIYERTKEIGVIKVLGCDMHNIRDMFLMESGFIGFMGGVIGIGLSYGISFLMNRFLGLSQMMMGIPGDISRIPAWLCGFAVVFAIFVGMAAGFFPSLRAMKLSPLAAIRNE